MLDATPINSITFKYFFSCKKDQAISNIVNAQLCLAVLNAAKNKPLPKKTVIPIAVSI